MEKKKNWVLGVIMSCVPVAIFFVANIIVSFIVQIPYTVSIVAKAQAEGVSVDVLTDPKWIEEQILSSGCIGLATLIGDLLIALGMFFWWRAIRSEEVPAKKAFTGKNVLFLVLLGIFIQGFLNVALGLIFMVLPSGVVESYQALSNVLSADTLIIIASVVAAPLCEEVLMRGIALHYGRKYMNDTAAVIISSVAFGCMHFGNATAGFAGAFIQVIYATLIGVILALVTIKFKTLWASIFVHFVVNGSAQLLMFIPGGEETDSLAGLVLIIASVISLVVMIIMYRKNSVTLPEGPTFGEIKLAAVNENAGEVAENN